MPSQAELQRQSEVYAAADYRQNLAQLQVQQEAEAEAEV